jgi:uracil-DNA glycosylase
LTMKFSRADSEHEVKIENNGWFDRDCRSCDRLAAHLDEVSQGYPDYHCKPVPPFGDHKARLLIVGLAPGTHGANASGRPFTGDHAGILLYQTLYRFGFASNSESRHRGDGLELFDCRITNAVKCLPPANKPTIDEVRNCQVFLDREIASLPNRAVVLVLGAIAHGAVLRTLKLRVSHFPFAHGAHYKLDRGIQLLASYHCSRYNTQTRRLTEPMFDSIFQTARQLLQEQDR